MPCIGYAGGRGKEGRGEDIQSRGRKEKLGTNVRGRVSVMVIMKRKSLKLGERVEKRTHNTGDKRIPPASQLVCADHTSLLRLPMLKIHVMTILIISSSGLLYTASVKLTRGS